MSTAEAYYREVNGLSVEENPILGREHHKVIELLEDYHRGMTQVKNNDLLHDVSHQRELLIKFLEFGRDRHYTPLTQCSIIDMVEDFELNQ